MHSSSISRDQSHQAIASSQQSISRSTAHDILPVVSNVLSCLKGDRELRHGLLLPIGNNSINIGNTLYFLLLVTLYDRYRPIYLSRTTPTS
jgi:ubiquitin C-terminal hydrolase